MIPIVLCLNSAYTRQAAMVIYTALKNANPGTTYSFYLISFDLKQSDMDFVRLVASKFDNCHDLQFLKMEQNDYDSIPTKGRFGKETCFRLFLPRLVPNCPKLIYLDCDTMVLGDLSELFDTDLTGKAYAACSEKRIYTMRWNPIMSAHYYPRFRFFNQFGFDIFDDKTHYCNAGVMLINVEYWKQHDYLSRTLVFLKEHFDDPDFGCLDQDVLNILAWQDGFDSRVYIDWRYNMMAKFEGLKTIDKKDVVQQANLRMLYFDQNVDSIAPKIVHFSDAVKPWSGGKTFHEKLYRQEAKLMGWDIKIRSKRILQVLVKCVVLVATFVVPHGVAKLVSKYSSKLKSFFKKILPKRLIRLMRKVV